MNYATGWNMGGYSPDPDHVWITDNALDAAYYLLDAIERHADADLGDDEGERYDRGLGLIDRFIAAGCPGGEFDVAIPDERGYDWHYWITTTDEPIDEEN